MTVTSVDPLPKMILGAAWGPQKERMKSGIYFPLFLVLKVSASAPRSPAVHAIYYLPTDFQSPALFSARKPLSSSARRAGWQGFMYVLRKVPDGAFVRLV
jgi:type II restriction enzyme